MAKPLETSCPIAQCLKLLSGAWTSEIIWYLRDSERRFGDLKRDLGTVSPKVLSSRLRDLEKRGILTRKVLPTSPPTVEYSLTDLGYELQPVLKSMAKVGERLKRT